MLEPRAGHLSGELGGRERVLVVQPRRMGGAMRSVPSHADFMNDTQQRGKEAGSK